MSRKQKAPPQVEREHGRPAREQTGGPDSQEPAGNPIDPLPKAATPEPHWLKILLDQLGPKVAWSLLGGLFLLVLVAVPSWLKYAGKYQDKIQEGQLYLNHGLYP